MLMMMMMAMSLQRANEASRLTWGKRMKAFVVCFVLGIVFCFLVSQCVWTASRCGSARYTTHFFCVSIAKSCEWYA